MQMLLSLISSTWYIWVLIILFSILKIYLPGIKGFFGEKSVALFLSRLDTAKYKVINDIMISTGDRTTQIDHVVVSNYGIFVIETKNYQGWILGNDNDDYWTQVIYKRKERLYNPIKQNYGHIIALKEHLKEYTDLRFVPIVVFTTKADLKVKTKSEVIYTVNLVNTIKKYDSEDISDGIKEEIYAKLINLNISDKESRKAHVKSIHENLAIKNSSIEEGVCPKCGGSLVLRNGKYGQFKGCRNYPQCRYIAK